MTAMITTGPTAASDLRSEVSLGELLASMRGELLTYARRRVGDDRSQEIVSEVFEAALKASQVGREVNPAWLVTVARNKVIDHWRRTERETRLVERLKAECPLFAHQDAEVASLDLGESAVTLGNLQPRHSSILVRHYVFGESLGTMAESDGVSYSAMESAMARARRSFRAEHDADGA